MSKQYSDDDYTAVQRHPDDPHETAQVCQECGKPLPYVCSTEVCDACLDKPVANGPRPVGRPVAAPRPIADPVPPFPSEPLSINQPDADHPVRFAVGGVQVWARTKEHARALLDEHTRTIDTSLLSDPFSSEPAFGSPESMEQAPRSIRRYGLNPEGRIFMLDDDQPDAFAYFANLEDHRKILAQRDALADAMESIRTKAARVIAGSAPKTAARAFADDLLAAADEALRKAGR